MRSFPLSFLLSYILGFSFQTPEKRKKNSTMGLLYGRDKPKNRKSKTLENSSLDPIKPKVRKSPEVRKNQGFSPKSHRKNHRKPKKNRKNQVYQSPLPSEVHLASAPRLLSQLRQGRRDHAPGRLSGRGAEAASGFSRP